VIVMSFLMNICFIIFIVFCILGLIELIKLCIWVSKKKEKWIREDEYNLKSFKFNIYFILMGLAGFLYKFLMSIL
jgi:hypothetical protein